MGYLIWFIYGIISTSNLSPQDVCIPDLIKLLDILGDNGVSLTFNICFPLFDIVSECETYLIQLLSTLSTEFKKWRTSSHYPSKYSPVSGWEG